MKKKYPARLPEQQGIWEVKSGKRVYRVEVVRLDFGDFIDFAIREIQDDEEVLSSIYGDDVFNEYDRFRFIKPTKTKLEPA